MRKTFGVPALVAALILGAGCKKASPLEGKWTAQEGPTDVEWEFKPDGTATMTTKNGPIQVTADETYKIEGKSLTVTTKAVDIKGGKPDQAAYIKSLAQSQVGKEVTSTVAFPSDDQIAVSGKMGSVTLTRAKG